MAYIKRFDFEIESKGKIKNYRQNGTKVGENWPVVYIINNDEEAYIGQTTNIYNRTSQHLDTASKSHLTEIRIISDDDFNVSVALDLEAYLIKHMGSDKKYSLINGNHGIQDHDYYDRKKYERDFRLIWNKLKRQGVVTHTIEDIENSDLYKYSPYKSLGSEQRETEYEILRALAESTESGKGATIIVKGGAGTGKTILAIYLMKLFADINNHPLEFNEEDEYTDVSPEYVYAAESIPGIKKIGIVFPQKTLRSSVKDVFRSVNGLDPCMVLDTGDVVDEYFASGKTPFDLLIVDEAHRLKTRKNGGNMLNNKKFNDKCRALGLDPNEDSELDWIMMCSKNQIVFRDDKQTVRAVDMNKKQFDDVAGTQYETVFIEQSLFTQWRCQGGKEYTDYVRDILDCTADRFLTVENYDFKLYEDVDRMVKDIKNLNKEYGLCRNAAGYAWGWKTKTKKGKKKADYDILIDGHKYKWNSTYDNWINSENAINEIGCIHTVQGYDLNYLGVIIGEDIKYDPEKKCIVSDVNNYHDSLGKTGLTKDPEKLKEYLVNIYLTLMTRGIRGTYVYVCDPALREYMAKFIEKA